MRQPTIAPYLLRRSVPKCWNISSIPTSWTTLKGTPSSHQPSLVYRTICSTSDTVQLQQDLSALEKWERDWQMAFHPQKCTTIHISRKRHPIKASYHLHGHTLEEVPSGKYLGVTISEDLSWREHINATSAKATRSVGFLRRNLRNCPKPGIYNSCASSTGICIGCVGPLSTTTDQSTRECSAPSSQICHRGLHVQGPRQYVEHVTPARMGTTGAPESQEPHHHALQNTTPHCRGPGSPSTAYQHQQNMGSTANNIRQISTRIDVYKYSFLPATIVAWNNIPATIRNSPSVDTFRHAINTISVSTILHH